MIGFLRNPILTLLFQFFQINFFIPQEVPAALLAFFQPGIIARYADFRSGRTVGANYQAEFNVITQQPGALDAMTVKVENSGNETWHAQGER